MNNPAYGRRDMFSRGFIENTYLSASTFDKAMILPPGYEHVKAALDYLAKLKDNWNGENAIAPTEQAIEAAYAINNKFFPISLTKRYPDKVSPDGDGAVLFIWNDQEKRLTLTIEAALIHISVAYNDGSIDLPESVPYDLNAIPKEVLYYIPKVK